MDIESHSMTHPPNLNMLNQNQLDYQIGGSKQCLANHGYNSTIFAYPYNIGSNDPTVVNTVAKYYNIGRSGTAPEARSLSFDIIEIKDSFNNTKMFSDFVKLVNSQSTYNQGGRIKVVPLLIFHNVDWVTNRPYNTNVALFDQLMKYLYENHFKVLTYK